MGDNGDGGDGGYNSLQFLPFWYDVVTPVRDSGMGMTGSRTSLDLSWDCFLLVIVHAGHVHF
jgi:hypothetical protein